MSSAASKIRERSFVVLYDSKYADRACTDLSAQFGFTKRQYGLWVPREILGMWVGPDPDILSEHDPTRDSSLPQRPLLRLKLNSVTGLPGKWMLYSFQDPRLSRARLLDQLVSSGAKLKGDPEPRFIPVFSRSIASETRRTELNVLRMQHPGEICRPLLMNPMSGALSRS